MGLSKVRSRKDSKHMKPGKDAKSPRRLVTAQAGPPLTSTRLREEEERGKGPGTRCPASQNGTGDTSGQ